MYTNFLVWRNANFHPPHDLWKWSSRTNKPNTIILAHILKWTIFARMASSLEAHEVQVLKYPKTPHLPFSPGMYILLCSPVSPSFTLWLSLCLGVSEDDTVLSCVECKLPILLEETVLTEKLDGGNCSIHCGKVGLLWFGIVYHWLSIFGLWPHA